jgi:hypothetical protein
MAEDRGAFPAQRARLALRTPRCDVPGLCPGNLLLLAYAAGLLVAGVTGAAALGWAAGVTTLLVVVLAPWRARDPDLRPLDAVPGCSQSGPWPRRIRACVRPLDEDR